MGQDYEIPMEFSLLPEQVISAIDSNFIPTTTYWNENCQSFYNSLNIYQQFCGTQQYNFQHAYVHRPIVQLQSSYNGQNQKQYYDFKKPYYQYVNSQ